MKKRYQIDKQRAAQQFRKQAGASQQQIQFALPLPEILALIQRGLMNLALVAFTQLAEEMMRWEVHTLAGPKNQSAAGRDNMRWGSQLGYCVVGGQKVPLERPRVRDVRNREVPLGSYEMLQQASLMEESVWHKILHGLTTRRYSEVVRELEQAYGIEKSTVSEHFIEASRRRLEMVSGRPLDEHALCAMMIDGTCFEDQQVVVAIGLTLQGHKVVRNPSIANRNRDSTVPMGHWRSACAWMPVWRARRGRNADRNGLRKDLAREAGRVSTERSEPRSENRCGNIPSVSRSDPHG